MSDQAASPEVCAVYFVKFTIFCFFDRGNKAPVAIDLPFSFGTERWADQPWVRPSARKHESNIDAGQAEIEAVAARDDLLASVHDVVGWSTAAQRSAFARRLGQAGLR